jgi:hypothetical protein
VLPAHEAAIHMSDFRSVHELAAYVKSAMNDPAIYQRHLAWKSTPLPAAVKKQIEMQMGNSYCRLCDHLAGSKADKEEL